MHAKLLQSYPTLCDPMDCSPPGSSVHGILQARTLEWVAMPSSRGSSQPRDRMQISSASCVGRRVHSLPLAPPGKPNWSTKSLPNLSKSLFIHNCHQHSRPGFYSFPKWRSCTGKSCIFFLGRVCCNDDGKMEN